MENTKVSVENFDWAAFESESGLYDQSVEQIEKAYAERIDYMYTTEGKKLLNPQNLDALK